MRIKSTEKRWGTIPRRPSTMLRSPHCTLHTHPSNLRSGHERARKEMVSVRSTRWFCRETVLARGCGDRSHVHQVRRTHRCVCVCVYAYAHTNHGKQRRRRRAFQQPRWRRIEPWAGSKRTGGQDQHHSRAEKKGSKKGKESRRSMAPRHSERRSLSRSLFHAHPGCPITGESGNYAASD